jgi:hypothetical protein
MLERLIVFVEEESVEAALNALLPRLMPEADFEIIRFQGKPDLLRNLPGRLRGYKSWLPSTWRILVLVDRDDDDCRALKEKLETAAKQAKLLSKTAVDAGGTFQIANRIAIEELEAWFFGDWRAVRMQYPKVPATIPQRERYRDPDAVTGGTWEALERIMQRKGYFRSGLRKIELARSVAQHLDPSRNTSRSFKAFCDAIAAARAL